MDGRYSRSTYCYMKGGQYIFLSGSISDSESLVDLDIFLINLAYGRGDRAILFVGIMGGVLSSAHSSTYEFTCVAVDPTTARATLDRNPLY